MCAKLKCCLNYEVDNYVEASRKLPPKDAVLQTADGDFHQFKVDILAGLITYSSDEDPGFQPRNPISSSVPRKSSK